MNKKTERKVKNVNKPAQSHWSAFDEAAWGPTRLRVFLDDLKQDIEDGDVLTLAQFTARQGITLNYVDRLARKHDFFRFGLDVLKELIYAKRFELAADDPDNMDLVNEFGLKHYDGLRLLEKESDDEADVQRHKKKREIDLENSLKLATHQSALRQKELQSLSPLAQLPHFIQASNGLFYRNMEDNGMTQGEVECFLKDYQESTTSKPDGTSNQ